MEAKNQGQANPNPIAEGEARVVLLVVRPNLYTAQINHHDFDTDLSTREIYDWLRENERKYIFAPFQSTHFIDTGNGNAILINDSIFFEEQRTYSLTLQLK